MGGVARSCVAVAAVCVMTMNVETSAGGQAMSFDRNVIVIDPAHGGADAGARVGEQVQEKDVTMAMAARLRTLLVADGFHVVMTRNGDVDGGSLDQRAEIANRSHAVACLVLHASSSTKGVLLGMSGLRSAMMQPAGRTEEDPHAAMPWSRAQEPYVAQSGLLANRTGTALMRGGIPATIMRVTMRPLDNLTCPAISVELGVPAAEEGHSLPISDGGYQQRVAEMIAATLTVWRSQAQLPEPLSAALDGARFDRLSRATSWSGVSP